MVIANWVEKKLEERRIKREQMLIEEGRKEAFERGRKDGFEQGPAYERERIMNEANGNIVDDPPHSKNRR